MYLGIDLGTSSLKLLLIDEEQRSVASASSALDLQRPHPGWSEQDPAAWITALEGAFDALARDHAKELSAVRGIGLSGQMHGATLLDKEDKPLRSCILWNDTRSAEQAARLDADPRFRRLSGNIVFPGFTAPKLVWIEEKEPAIFARTRKVLLPKDYLRLWLTGEHVSDLSDAAGTAWLDTGARCWSDALLTAGEMTREQMPRLVEGTAPSGQLRGALARRWGLQPGIPVAGGAGDNAASAVGMGTIAAGSAFVSLGTSGVLFAANDGYRPCPEEAVHAFCHAVPGTWHQMGVILSAASALDWLAKTLGQTPADLMALVGDEPVPPGGLLFLPYLSGERTPHNDAAIRGAFVGLDHQHGPADLTHAVLQGVAFALRDSLEALRKAGTCLDHLTAVGGGAKSHTWLTLIATTLNLPLTIPKEGNLGAAFGAARLGLIAAEGADPAAVCKAPEMTETFLPDRGLQEGCEEGYKRFRQLYPALVGLR